MTTRISSPWLQELDKLHMELFPSDTDYQPVWPPSPYPPPFALGPFP
jgi:hypothetical protein